MFIQGNSPTSAYLGSDPVTGIYYDQNLIWPLDGFIPSASIVVDLHRGQLWTTNGPAGRLIDPEYISWTGSYTNPGQIPTDFSRYVEVTTIEGEYKMKPYAFNNSSVSWNIVGAMRSYKDGGYCVELGSNMFGNTIVPTGSEFNLFREMIFPSPKLHWQNTAIQGYSGSLKLTDARNPIYTVNTSGRAIINSTIEIEGSNWNNAWKNLTEIKTQFIFGTRFVNFSGSMDYPNATVLDGLGNFFGVKGVDTLNLPEAVGRTWGDQSVDSQTFRNSGFRVINAPKIRAVNHSTFKECRQLEIVDVRSLESASYDLFRDCVSLHTINFSSARTGSIFNFAPMVSNVPNNGTITLPQHWSGSNHQMYTALQSKNWNFIYV